MVKGGEGRAVVPGHAFAFLLIVGGTVLGIAGTDLVLPAVPGLPAILGGTLSQAQLVLAAFVAGAACGLLLFGTLGARFDQRTLLAASLGAYALISAACSLSGSLDMLITLRFLQGAAGSAAAVFAPGMLRALYGDQKAVSALGLLGSIEALTPALAPIAGLWLLKLFGWEATFDVIAILAALLAVAVLAWRQHLPALITRRGVHGYRHLLRDRVFLRYALTYAFTLGAMLVIVFGAPTVFVAALGGTLTDFIIMQGTGIASFIVVANMTGRLSARHGSERMIWVGTALSGLAAALILVYALLGGADTRIVTALFVPFNMGLGLRGPPGFHKAVLAARGDDARGAALVVVALLGTTAIGTAAVAPFITDGLLPLGAASGILMALAILLLALLPKLEESPLPSESGPA